MSAWLCSSEQIAAIVTGMRKNGIVALSHAARDKAFKTLMSENMKSLGYRYEHLGGASAFHDENTDAAHLKESLRWADFGVDLNKDSLLKQVQCYMYQACEHPDWKKSPAYALCAKIVDALAEKGASPRNPAYEQAAWGI